MPVVAGHIRRGNMRGAIEAVGDPAVLCQPSRADNLVLDAWAEARRGAGAMGAPPFDALMLRCDALGLGPRTRLEVLERVALVDRQVRDYHAALAGRAGASLAADDGEVS